MGQVIQKGFVKPSELMPTNVWKPNAGSQAEAFDLNANEILYWGDRGPGKTSWQVARALSRFFLGYGRFYKVLMMGLRIKSLSGVVNEVEKILTLLEKHKKVECKRQRKSGDWAWFAPDGEEFRVINLKEIAQAEDMIGQEYNVQLWNELCHYPSPKLYIMLSGSARSAFDPIRNTPKNYRGDYMTPDGCPLPPCPEEILAASNTKGVGKLWVRKKFIEPANPTNEYQLRTVTTTHEIRDQVEIFVTKSIQGVQGENPNLSTRYLATLREQTKFDPALKREWCEGGDWYTPSGGAFDHLWDSDKHVLLGKLNLSTSDWDHCLSVSYSSSRPTCVLWSAECDRATRLGDLIFPAGSVIFYHELYLCDIGDPHLGNKMSIRSLVRKIKEESQLLIDEGVVSGVICDGFGSRNLFTPIAGGILADRLADNEIYLDQVDNIIDRRELKEAGLTLVRERLSASAEGQEDGIYFSESCVHSIRTLPDLPVDEDDPTVIDDESEDYCYEAVRLRAMSMSLPTEEFNIGFA